MKPNCQKCNKWCCRLYNITLTDREKKSGLYVINNAFYTISGQAQLQKKDDGSCYYLDNDLGCTIYNDRPEMCRKYWCIDAGHTPDEFIPLYLDGQVKPQSAQIRCYKDNCKYNNDNRCINISPAIDLRVNTIGDDVFTCHSEKDK